MKKQPQPGDHGPVPGYYTHGDTQIFESLMNFPGATRPGPGSGADTAAPASSSTFPYTRSNTRESGKLNTFDTGRKETSRPVRAARASAATSSIYTDSDNRIFNELAPGIQKSGTTREEDRAQQPSRGDKDVGHIRIVDFDKECSREKNSARGSAGIKIHFFE